MVTTANPQGMSVTAQLLLDLNKQTLWRSISQIDKAFASHVFKPKVVFSPQAFGQMRREVNRTTDDLFAMVGGFATLNKRLNELPASFNAAFRNGKKLREQLRSLQGTDSDWRHIDRGVDGMSRSVQHATRDFGAFDAATARWLGTIYLVNRAVSGLKSQLDFSKSITKFAQVADIPVRSALPFARQTQALGMKYGADSRNILGFSSTLKQAGLGTAETKQYAEAIAQMSLSSQVSNVEELAKPLVILRNNMGFRKPDESINALGKLLQVSKDYPVGLSEITSGLEKSASVFPGDFNELIAAITTAASISQTSGTVTGTAIKSLRQRTQSKTHLANLRSMGVDLTEGGNLLPFSKRLERLSMATSGLSEDDPRKANILAEAGGLHHVGILQSLVDNYSEYLSVLNKLDAINGAESIFREADIAAGSLNNQIDKAREAFGKFFAGALFNQSADNALKNILSTVTVLADKSSSLAPLFILMAGKYGASKAKGFLPEVAAPEMFRTGGLISFAERRGKLGGMGRAVLSKGGLSTLGLGFSYAASQQQGMSGVLGSAGVAASSAALLGFGPWGIAIGASTLALQKFATQIEEANASLKDRAVSQGGDALRKAVDLGQAANVRSSLQTLVNEYEGQRFLSQNISGPRTALEIGKNIASFNWSALSPTKAREGLTAERLEAVKNRFAELSDVTSQLTEETTKQYTSLADFQKSAVGDNLIKLGVAAGADRSVLEAHITTLIESNNAERARIEASRRAEAEAKKTAEALNQLSSSIFRYESGLSRTRVGFEEATPNRLSSLSDPQSFLPQLSLGLASPKFRSSLNSLPGIDPNTSKLLDQLKTVADKMPDWIDQNRMNLGSSDRLSTMLLSRPFMNGLDNTINQVLVNTAKDMGESDWTEGLASPSALTSQLMKRFDPLLSELDRVGQSFAEFRQRALENLTTVFDQRNRAIGARASAQTATLDAREFAKQVEYQRGGRLRPLDVMGPERIVQEQVASLTGGLSGVGSISAQIRAFSDALKQTGDGRFALGINNATQALQLLSDTTRRLSALQSEYANVQGMKGAKLGYAEAYYGSDIQSRIQMDKQTAAAVMAISQGRTVHNTSVQTQQEVISGLRLMRGTGPLDSLGGRTPEQAMEKFLGVDTRKEDRAINALQNQMLRIMKDGAAAQWEVARFEQQNFQYLVSNLDKNNKEITQAIANMTANVNVAGFQQAVNQFNNGVAILEKAVAAIPEQIEMTVNGARLEVVHMNLNWLNGLEPAIKNIVQTQIQKAIGKNNRANPTRPPQMS